VSLSADDPLPRVPFFFAAPAAVVAIAKSPPLLDEAAADAAESRAASVLKTYVVT